MKWQQALQDRGLDMRRAKESLLVFTSPAQMTAWTMESHDS